MANVSAWSYRGSSRRAGDYGRARLVQPRHMSAPRNKPPCRAISATIFRLNPSIAAAGVRQVGGRRGGDGGVELPLPKASELDALGGVDLILERRPDELRVDPPRVASAPTARGTCRTRAGSTMGPPSTHLDAATGSAVSRRWAAASTKREQRMGSSARATGAAPRPRPRQSPMLRRTVSHGGP